MKILSLKFLYEYEDLNKVVSGLRNFQKNPRIDTSFYNSRKPTSIDDFEP